MITDWVDYVSPVPAAKPLIAGELDDPATASQPAGLPDPGGHQAAARLLRLQGDLRPRRVDRDVRADHPVVSPGQRLRRALVPYLLSLPTALWLGALLRRSAGDDRLALADDRQLDRRLPRSPGTSRLPGRDRHLRHPVRALVLLRDRVDGDRARGHVPGRVLDRVPRRAAQVDAAVPPAAAVLRLVRDPDPDAGSSSSPTRGSCSGRSRTSGSCPRTCTSCRRPFAVIAGLTYDALPFMALPLYVALERIDRSLVEAGADLYASPVQTVHQGDPAALGARASTRGSCWSRSPTSATT